LRLVHDQITAAGGTALSLPTDVANEAECDRMIEETVSRFGGIDVLVLNGGSATYGRLDELHTFAPIRDSMAINFFGVAEPRRSYRITLLPR
jgi:NAD(P)-dependent dehydrogenase (short-subunit alcohol dehydrogenase family)